MSGTKVISIMLTLAFTALAVKDNQYCKGEVDCAQKCSHFYLKLASLKIKSMEASDWAKTGLRLIS